MKPGVVMVLLVVVVHFLCPRASAQEATPEVGEKGVGVAEKRFLESAILRVINLRRREEGFVDLKRDAVLQQLADRWVARLVESGRMEHRKNLPNLRRQNGFSYLNENLYRFSAVPDAERVVKAWMKSRGHRRNLLSPKAVLGAVALGFTADGGTVVVFQGAGR